MTVVHLKPHGYRYLPYEHVLAHREIEAVLGMPPDNEASTFSVSLNGHSFELARRLTYVRSAVLPGKAAILTDQARLEDSARASANGDSFRGPLRQSTRYSAHGLHEFRGKFNPQIVRAIGNLVHLREGDWILDPFCGSGTALTEAAHNKWNCIGVDMNPLAVLISNAKIQALNTSSHMLQRGSAEVADVLNKRVARLKFDDQWTEATMDRVAGRNWRSSLPDEAYLIRWFPPAVLAQLVAILKAIDQHEKIAQVLRVILSDVVRRVSYQDPGDLRIRRRKIVDVNYPVIPWFIDALRDRVGTVIRAQMAVPVEGKQLAMLGDCRTLIKPQIDGLAPRSGFDAVITSPPYATALPYIDTQRLSLVLLGLTSAREVANLEEQLIGTREVSQRQRAILEGSIAVDRTIPEGVRQLCLSMLAAVRSSSSDGFRRINTPAVVYQYFRDMGKVLINVAKVTKPGGSFVLIVGRNRTILGGRPFLVNTPQLLAESAELHGWSLVEAIELDTYQRFDMHQRNSIRSETMLILKTPD